MFVHQSFEAPETKLVSSVFDEYLCKDARNVAGIVQSFIYQVVQEHDKEGKLRSQYKTKFGVPDGLYQEWHGNGQLSKECTYEDGNLHGFSRKWFESGQLSEETIYQNNRPFFVYRDWYEHGGLHQEWKIHEMVEMVYDCKEWYGDGLIHKEWRWMFDNGTSPILDGVYRQYYANGQVEKECTYDRGALHGLFREWYESGQIAKECTYVHDQLH